MVKSCWTIPGTTTVTLVGPVFTFFLHLVANEKLKNKKLKKKRKKG